MNQLRKTSYIIISIFLLLPFKHFGQNIEQKEASKRNLINAAREIITDSGTCALITLDEKGLPMVRVMDPFPPESDFTVWFGTNPKSRKVKQIKNNPKVTLYYLNSDASGYVVIHGTAHLVDDPKVKQKRWKEEWEAFYPNKQEAYLLIKVSPKWMEVISYKHDIIGDPITWETPVVFFD